MRNKTHLDYPALSGIAEDGHKKCPLRICIVTPDLVGPVKNGGIGTACSNLAYALAQAGNSVEILFTKTDSIMEEEWRKKYSDEGIKLSRPQNADGKFFPSHPPLVMALQVYEWLKKQPEFALVIFMDWMGNGFYAIHAKKCGLFFKDSTFVVVLHSPSFWHAVNNASVAGNPIESCTWHMERQCIELADALVSPSKYMLGWCAEHGYKLPAKAFVQPNLFEKDNPMPVPASAPAEEIVFFGRLEYRKGLGQFCEAMNILARRNKLPAQVTFLGKCGFMGSEHCIQYISRHSRNWQNCRIRFHLHYGRQRAMEYLRGRGRLAVMPSVEDNSPYTVYECLMAGVPFLARNVGGICELISPADHERTLFGDNPRELADRIEAAGQRSPQPANLSFSPQRNQEAWLNGLAELGKRAGRQNVEKWEQRPFISVCLTHYNRPGFLVQAVRSFLAQTYENFEVILADDGSDSSEALKCLIELEPIFQKKGWQILRLENGYASRARNSAARRSRGTWLLFFDDDNIALPDMLETFAIAASMSRAGLISCSFRVFAGMEHPDTDSGVERFLPLGSIISYSLIHNAIGDTASLIRKDVFEKYGGFTEDYGLGNEDFELFLRFALGGETIAIIPDAIFWYRRNPEMPSVNLNTNGAANRMRSMRPYLESFSPPLNELVFMAHGLAVAQNLCGEGGIRSNIPGYCADPQDKDFLEKVGFCLEQNGQTELAKILYMALAEMHDEKIPHLIDTRNAIRQAIQNGEEEKTRKLLTEIGMENSGAITGQSLESLYQLYLDTIKILPSGWHSLRSGLIESLSGKLTDNIEVNLYLSAEKSKSDSGSALIFFFRALGAAERKYLTKRPDVANAIKDGIFTCGLYHYSFYGRTEGLIWPAQRQFVETLVKLDALHEKIFQVHASAYKYKQIELSRKIFSVFGKLSI